MYYTFDSRIRYSEVDGGGLLRPDALMDYFQDCSTFQSEDGGVGIGYMKDTHSHWLVSYYQIEIARYPVYGEKVRIGTVPYESRGFLGLRNFFMETEGGERLATANSVWSLIDLRRMLPVHIPQKMLDCYVLHDKLEMNYLPRKMKFPEGDSEERDIITVSELYLDSNHHVNNVQYVRFALKQIPEDRIITRLRVEYKKQALLGDRIHVVMHTSENGKVTAALNADDGSTYVIVELKLRPRRPEESDAWIRRD